MMSWPLVRYVLMAALRDRLVISLGLLIVVGICLSIFLGSAALTEYDQFARVFAASGLRFTGVVGLVLFVVFYIRRSFDNKDVDFLLSRPISRTGFILAHALAFSLIAVALSLTIGLAVCVVSPGTIGIGHALWVLSLMIELIIIVNAALFFSMVLSSAAGGAMAVFGLYVLARLMGQLLGIAGKDGGPILAPILEWTMNIVSIVVPRLDLMAQTTWLIYPESIGEVNFTFVIFQGIIYTGLILCAALIDLRRRQF
ncbi:MAG: hypothetical protein ACXW30_02725 [Micavibrio sp.]